MDLRLVSRAAESLYAAACSHKRAAAFHRRRAAELMRQYDELHALCAQHGISLEITQARGGHSE